MIPVCYMLSKAADSLCIDGEEFIWHLDAADGGERFSRIRILESMDPSGLGEHVRALFRLGIRPVLVLSLTDRLPRTDEHPLLRGLGVIRMGRADMIADSTGLRRELASPDADLLTDLADFRAGRWADLGSCRVGTARRSQRFWSSYSDAMDRWLESDAGRQWLDDHPVAISRSPARDEFAPGELAGRDHVFRLECAPTARLIRRAEAGTWHSAGGLPDPDTLDADGSLRAGIAKEIDRLERYLRFVTRMEPVAEHLAAAGAGNRPGPGRLEFNSQDGRFALSVEADPATQRGSMELVDREPMRPAGAPGDHPVVFDTAIVDLPNGRTLVLRPSGSAKGSLGSAGDATVHEADVREVLSSRRWSVELPLAELKEVFPPDMPLDSMFIGVRLVA